MGTLGRNKLGGGGGKNNTISGENVLKPFKPIIPAHQSPQAFLANHRNLPQCQESLTLTRTHNEWIAFGHRI